jgi:dipeptidyl aminopeptidase/acylaminoacyl peptidase
MWLNFLSVTTRDFDHHTTISEGGTPVNDSFLPGLSRRALLAAMAAVSSIDAMLPSTAFAQGTKADPAKFFARPQLLGAALSPDGKRVAMRSLGPEGRVRLAVLNLETMSQNLAFAAEDGDVRQFNWVNSERLVFDLEDREAPVADQDAAPGLFAVDHDGKRYKQLVERQIAWIRNGNDNIHMEPWNTFLLNASTQRKGVDVFVYRPEQFDGAQASYIKLLRLNTVTGRATELDGPKHSVGWWVDAQGELRVAQTVLGEKGAILWRDPSGVWRTLREFDAFTEDGDLNVSHVGADGKLYVSARRDGDKLAMWLLDPATGEFSAKPLASSPRFDVDAAVVERADKVLGLRFHVDAEVTQWMDADMAALQVQIDKVLPRTVNRLSVPWTGSEPWLLIQAFADIQPTMDLLFNRSTRKFVRLGGLRPDIDAKQMASMDLLWLKARDGLDLPAWLSLPNGESKKNLPMVVLVHGGPWVRLPDWKWDAQVQFLNARGYAVLQPQFRGTAGLGSKHLRSSWRQWGRSMQADLADATRWAIEQGMADPKRIAIMGASYGGYAALMGLVRDPGLFRVGVAWVGVTDLDLMYGAYWSDFSSDVKRYGLPKLLGDRVNDAAELRENSPITHAGKITQPLLLAYGERDRRVPIEHGSRLRRALPDSNKNVEWITYSKEGHGWRELATQIDFWSRTAAFLDKHLAA